MSDTFFLALYFSSLTLFLLLCVVQFFPSRIMDSPPRYAPNTLPCNDEKNHCCIHCCDLESEEERKRREEEEKEKEEYKFSATFYKKFFEIYHLLHCYIAPSRDAYEKFKTALKLHCVRELDPTPKDCTRVTKNFYSDHPPWQLTLAVTIQHTLLFN